MSARSPQDWSEFAARRLDGASLVHPLTAEVVRSVCQSDTFRVEQNRVRIAGLDEVCEVIRAVSLDETRYEAVVVPVLDDGRLLLVSRYRYAIERWSVEFPRFAAQSSDEGWKQSAEASLLQHYGLATTNMSLLGAFQADAATLAVTTVVILATGCTQKSAPKTDPRTLVAGTVGVAPAELGQLLRQGEIACGVSLAALALYEACKRG